MTTSLISYPFRLDGRGYVTVREDDDEAYYAEELAQLVQTTPGERDLVPDYGIEDPAFSVFPVDELKAKVAMFGPPVVISNVVTQFKTEGVADISVEFQTPIDYRSEDVTSIPQLF